MKNCFKAWGRVKEKLQAVVEGLEEDNRKLEEIDQNIGQLKSAVQKHDMAIEDLLEEWEDKKSEKDGFRKRIQDCEQSENLLLELFESYQGQTDRRNNQLGLFI